MSTESPQKLLILKVAQRFFARYGFKKTSMDEIASEAHISKATIYLHFSGKEDVFASVVRQESAALIHDLEQAVTRAQGAEAKVRSFLETRMAKLKVLANLHRVSDETLSELMPLSEEARQDYFQQEVKLLERILTDGRAAGAFELESPHIVALALLSSLKGIDVIFLRMRETPELEDGVAEMLKLLFRGLSPRS